MADRIRFRAARTAGSAGRSRPARAGSAGRRRAGLLAAAALTALAVLPAAPARAETLKQVLAEVYLDNPTIRAARARLRQTNEQVPQALAGWRPTVTVTSSLGARTVDTEDRFRREGDSLPVDARLEVEQPIYRGGKTFAELDRAERRVEAGRAELQATTQEVFARTVRAYADVLRDRRILELTERNVEILRELLDATAERLAEGFATATDRAEAESRLAGAIARRDDARGRLQASRARFEELVGRLPRGLEPVGAPPGLPDSERSAVAGARADNPAVRQARLEAEAARAGVRVARGDLLPRLALRGSAGHADDFERSDVTTDDAALRLQLEVPLFQGGAVYSRVRQAKQGASRRRIQVAEAVRAARQQAKSAWADYTATVQRIDALDRQVQQAQAALDGAREEFQGGNRTIRDVLDAETERIGAAIQRARARRDRDVAAFRLLRATGRLTVGRLDLPVAEIRPDMDYEAVRDAWIGVAAPGTDTAAAPRSGAAGE